MRWNDFPVAEDLNTAFASTPGLARYVQQIRTLVSRELVSSCIEISYHYFVAVYLDQICTVIDLVSSAGAFMIPLNDNFETKQYLKTSRRRNQQWFHCSLGYKGEELWTMEEIGDNGPAALFAEIDHQIALQQISIRATHETEPWTKEPKRKSNVIRNEVRGKPSKIVATYSDAGYITTSCQLQVDFSRKTMTIHIPLKEWLLKPCKEGTPCPLQRR